MNNKGWVWTATILGIIFIIIGLVYATHQIGSLPHFFPGYVAGMTGKHVKHSLLAFILGVLCFVFAWFKSAPKAA
jgi:hypothetical protein